MTWLAYFHIRPSQYVTMSSTAPDVKGQDGMMTHCLVCVCFSKHHVLTVEMWSNFWTMIWALWKEHYVVIRAVRSTRGIHSRRNPYGKFCYYSNFNQPTPSIRLNLVLRVSKRQKVWATLTGMEMRQQNVDFPKGWFRFLLLDTSLLACHHHHHVANIMKRTGVKYKLPTSFLLRLLNYWQPVVCVCCCLLPAPVWQITRTLTLESNICIRRDMTELLSVQFTIV